MSGEDEEDETKPRRSVVRVERESSLQRETSPRADRKREETRKSKIEGTWIHRGVKKGESRVKIHVQKDCLSSVKGDDRLRRENDKRKSLNGTEVRG